MKDPKALFPLLFGSSWVGNLVLTVLAFYLAFTYPDPLTPLVFLTVAACILSGNLLPIGVYWILVRWREAELQAESAEANVRIREALRRSEEVLGRLDETEGALAKSILVARQVPERISEKLQALESLAESLKEGGLEKLTAALRPGSGASGEGDRDFHAALQRLEDQLSGLAGADKPPADNGVSLSEKLDLLNDALEGIQDSLGDLLVEVAKVQVHSAPSGPPPAKKAARKTARRKKAQPAPADPQPDLQLEAEADPPAETSDGGVQLTVHAMVGISNKLYLRGDAPLSWEAGAPMDLVGIGEFSWTDSGIDEPIEVSVLLNDAVEAEGGTIQLEPGKPLWLNLQFPK